MLNEENLKSLTVSLYQLIVSSWLPRPSWVLIMVKLPLLQAPENNRMPTCKHPHWCPPTTISWRTTKLMKSATAAKLLHINTDTNTGPISSSNFPSQASTIFKQIICDHHFLQYWVEYRGGSIRVSVEAITSRLQVRLPKKVLLVQPQDIVRLCNKVVAPGEKIFFCSDSVMPW